MPSPYCFIPLLLLISIKSRAQDSLNLIYCSGNNLTTPSFYKTNLPRLLTHLVVFTSKSPSFYYIETLGNSPTFQIFGLAQCRPYITAELCAQCLNHSASVAATGGCRSAVFRYDLCLLRYSDQRFFDIPDQKRVRLIPTKAPNATDSISPDTRDLLQEIFPAVASDEMRFKERSTNESGGQIINAIAWCTMDLSSSDCLGCLRRAAERLPTGKFLGIVQSVSCEMRLSTHPLSLVNSWPLLPLPASKPEVPAPQPWMPKGASREGKMNNTSKMILLVGAFGSIALFLLFTTVLLQNKRRNSKLALLSIGKGTDEELLNAMKILVFDLATTRAATNNFTEENTLGHCGYAVIYKGILQKGQEIAVKRLSRTSEQGPAEMENEVHLITKLQHKNLVRLLGYCFEGEEKLLVYEYLPNASLDKFLYDPIKRRQLDWGTRFKIIVGIGRGLLYLHEDSRHRIVHCNLKSSNILLDSTMSPKISEFGIAKLLSVDETERYTSQTVGTLDT